jgi:hypothetical protein
MKILLLTTLAALLTLSTHAATVTVTAGFGSQGFTVSGTTTPENPSGAFLVAVGYLDAGNFVQFGQSIMDVGEVNGVFTASGPSAANSQIIHLFVGNGPTVQDSTSYLIFRTNANTAFPPDVSSVGSTTFTATLPTVVTLVQSFNAGYLPGAQTLVVPEPSATFLALVAAGTLLRRRRRG